MTRWAVVLLALAACKGHKSAGGAAHGGSGSAVAAAPSVDDAACLAMLQRAPTLTPVRRISAILDACKPCGDWKPMLDWSVPTKDGGPTRQVLDEAMQRCHAYCNTDSKQHFLGTLDDARGTDSRTPWRILGEQCKEKVSAVPDARFESAPLFALDRIARYAAASPTLAPALADIELPLPAVGIGGVGIVLPAGAVISPTVRGILTVSQTELHLGRLPTGKLTADGVIVDASTYPGDAVKELPAALDAFKDPVAIMAPAQMPATRVRDVVLASEAHGTLHLAVVAPGAPRGWQLPGLLPIQLTAGDHATGALTVTDNPDATVAAIKAKGTSLGSPVALEIWPNATVQSLATVLGALAYFHVGTVTLIPFPVRH